MIHLRNICCKWHVTVWIMLQLLYIQRSSMAGTACHKHVFPYLLPSAIPSPARYWGADCACLDAAKAFDSLHVLPPMWKGAMEALTERNRIDRKGRLRCFLSILDKWSTLPCTCLSVRWRRSLLLTSRTDFGSIFSLDILLVSILMQWRKSSLCVNDKDGEKTSRHAVLSSSQAGNASDRYTPTRDLPYILMDVLFEGCAQDTITRYDRWVIVTILIELWTYASMG